MKRSLRSWLWQVDIIQEVDEELAFHIEMRTRELVESGVDRRVAREMVLARLGDVDRLKRTCVDLGRQRDREMRLTQWLGECRDDVRFAIRQLNAVPGFTMVAAVTLALGIGANSAMFALADATLLRPLPFRDAERLVLVLERGAQQLRSNIAPLSVHDWVAGSRTFEAMAAIYVSPGDGGPTLMAGDGNPETVVGQQVTSGFFDLLGVRPIAGRTFVTGDETSNPDVVVLSETFWQTRFGGDLTLVGRDVQLNGRSTTVIGIVPAEFHFQRTAGLWTLLPVPDAAAGRRPSFNLQVIGRLKPGVATAAARADLTPIADSLAQQYGDRRVGRYLTVEPLRDALIGGELRLTSLLLLGVVGFVLLMCCANVANLILARATIRTRELAVRSALGAGRHRIVRQLITESIVLAAIGGTLGVGVGAAILAVAPSLIPPDLLPGAIALAFDARVIAFCAATALVVGVLFGLAPAWHATGVSLAQSLTTESRTTTGGRARFRHLLVVGEVATAVLLLCGAGLLLRTLLTLESVDPGYGADADSVLTMDVTLPESRYPTSESLLQFYDRVEAEVAAVPGVRSVGWATTLPFGNAQIGQNVIHVVGDPLPPPDDRPAADYQIVSTTYFETMQLPIVAGRGFTERDTAASVPVCIVNEAFVRRYLAGREPIGARIELGSSGDGRGRGAGRVAHEVVGIARQVKGRVDEPEDFVQVYVPNAQVPWSEAYLVVRPTGGPVEALTPAVRAAIARVDKEQPVRRMVTLGHVAREATARYRFRAVMVVTFAGLALLLAMVGVFGVLAYSVQQRTREIGVRIALGATPGRVITLVWSSAWRMVAVGAAIGLLLAAALSRSISSFLVGVQAMDPITFTSVAGLLIVTAVVAIAVPAIRAIRVDPVEACRNE
jgi:putative ABC transport system permease protein